MTCQTPITQVGPIVSGARTNVFLNQKKQVIDTILGRPEEPSIAYTPLAFLGILQILTNPAKNYSGVRIYFAVYKTNLMDPVGNGLFPPAKEGNLTLIFVPTTRNIVTGKHEDDLNSCLIVVNNAVHILDMKTASFWIRHFQEFRLPNLEFNGKQVVGDDFKETRSIWYDIVFFCPNNGKSGLIDYVRCLITDNSPLDLVVIHFAGYTLTEDFPYKLTLIFRFNQSGIPGAQPFSKINATVNSFSFSTFDLKKSGVRLAGDDTDTGNPCPPNNCEGELLPLP